MRARNMKEAEELASKEKPAIPLVEPLEVFWVGAAVRTSRVLRLKQITKP